MGHAQRDDCADSTDTVGQNVCQKCRRRGVKARLAADKQDGEQQLERGRSQTQDDGRSDDGQLYHRVVEHRKRRVGTEHDRAEQVIGLTCKQVDTDTDRTGHRTQQDIDGGDGREQAGSPVFLVLFGHIAGVGVGHPRRDEQEGEVDHHVGRIKQTNRRFGQDVRVERRHRHEQHALGELGGQKQHGVARHRVFFRHGQNPF